MVPQSSLLNLADFMDTQGARHADAELAAVASWILDEQYELRPLGSETVTQLKDRIIYQLLSAYGSHIATRFDVETGEPVDVYLNDVVLNVSPLSRLKSGQALLPSRKPAGDLRYPFGQPSSTKTSSSWWLVGGIALAALGLWYWNRRK